MDSLRRRLAGTHGWTAADAAALIAAGSARLGRSLVVDRLTDLLAGRAHTGDGRHVTEATCAALPDLLAQAQVMAEAVADRDVSRSEARAILERIPELIRALDRLRADVGSLLEDHA